MSKGVVRDGGKEFTEETVIEAVNEQKIADVDGTAGVEDIYL